MSAANALPRTRTGRPKIRCTDDVLAYWAERIDLIAPAREDFERHSMICRGDSLFHYGRHFELARILRDKRGRARLVLLNGDSWGGGGGRGYSTSSRQSDVRSAVARKDVPSLIVPFSALEGARIDFATIAPIHVRGDRWTIEEHSSRTRPASLTTMPDPSGATQTEEYWDYRWGEQRSPERRTREVPVRVPNPKRTMPFTATHGWCEDGAQLGEDGVWRWSVRRHWLGDSIFRARSTERRTRKATAEELASYERHLAWGAEFRRLQSEQRRFAHQWWLREAWATAATQDAMNRHYERRPKDIPPHVRDGRVPIEVTRWATFLSSFDYQEARPLYFLCELPYGAKPNTVDEAIAALKPPEVVAAEARGVKVIRQGDLFAIPTKLTKRQIRRMRGKGDFTKRLRVLGTNHSVTEGIVCKGGAVLGRGVMRHEPDRGRAPDHAKQKLGNAWHLLVRNTVPRSQ